jgi:multidrug resistance efflux pump
VRRLLRHAALAVSASLLLPLLAGCATGASASVGGPISVAGFTRVDPVIVAAPALAQPTLDITVGIASLQTPALVAARRRKAATGVSARGPVVAGVLKDVRVRAGDMVRKGQVVAVFDDRMLLLGVDSATAAYRKAVASADTMKSTADDLRDQRAKIRTARRTLLAQQALLGTTAGKLRGQLAQLRTQTSQLEAAQARLRAARSDLAAKLALAEKLASSPTPPPGIAGMVAQLKSALAKVDGRLAAISGALPKLRAAVPQLTGALAKMAAAGPALAAAKAKIASALSKMADGISQLENASKVIGIAAAAQSTGVSIARYAVSQATIVSPVDGVVLSVRPSGQTVVVGAPIATIRPKGDVLVDAYLAPDQVSRVKVGDRADVTVDSLSGTLAGRVSAIGTGVEFPPANYPTQIVHLANAVHVTIAVPYASAPIGVPADVVIHPSS